LSSEEFVGLTEAARLLKISPAALKRRVDRGHLAVYRDPGDLRVKLFRRRDLDRYSVPRIQTSKELRAA
jgi:hypothetical protein